MAARTGKARAGETAKQDAKAKLLEAALTTIRTKGYAATTVDELCAAAGVTSGAFLARTHVRRCRRAPLRGPRRVPYPQLKKPTQHAV